LHLKLGWKSAAQARGPSRLDPWFALLSLMLPLLISLPLLGTDLITGEYAEFVLGTTTLGIVQFPGYPLYLLSTKFLSLLIPHDSEIWRINFVSLLFGTLSTLFIFLTGRRLRFSPFISLAAALLFFFSPVFWQEALLSHHYTFHLFLLTACLYVTISILGPHTWRNRRIRLFFWAFLCGLTGGQHPALLPWAITALVLVLGIGLPRHRARSSDYSLVFISILLGIILPYLYLPCRLLARPSFLNIDVICSHVQLPQSPSFTNISSWLIHYAAEGIRTFFYVHDFHTSLIQLWNNILTIIRSYPFFSLVIVLLGLLLNLRSMFIKQPSRSATDFDSTSRLTVTMLPLCALGGEALLLPEHSITTQLSLSLGCAYWSLKGMEYCYQILGHTDEILAKNQRLRPTWFGLLTILLVPFLAFIQNYSVFRHQLRQATNNQSTLIQTRTLLQDLPKQALVIFPTTDFSMAALYVQQRLGVRTDISLLPFSSLWPDMLPTSPSLPQRFSQNRKQRFTEKMQFSHQWIQGLSKKVSSGRHTFLILHPMIPTPTLAYLVQSFDLAEAHSPVQEWIQPNKQRFLSVYRIRRQPLPSKPKQIPLAKSFISEFESKIRLLSAQLHRPVKRQAKFALLKITLQWQVLQKISTEKLLVRFWITPTGNVKTIHMQDKKEHYWKRTRTLGNGYVLNRLKARTSFQETYQLVVPDNLPAGRYLVHVSVIDKTTNQPLTAGEHMGKSVYFTPACEFWVVTSDSGSTSCSP